MPMHACMHACRSLAMRLSTSALLLAAVACSMLPSSAVAQNQIGCYSTNLTAASLRYINQYTYGVTSVMPSRELSTSPNYTVCLSTNVSGWNYITPPGAQFAAYAFSGKQA